MKRIRLFLILLLAASTHGMAQSFKLYGLEIYNPSYNNPAYVGADKLIRADAMVYSNWLNSGLNSRIMATLPGGKSSLGAGFDNSSYFSGYTSTGPSEKTMNYFEFELAYKHTFQPWEDFKIHTGAAIYPAKLDYLKPGNGIDSSLLYNRSLSTAIGVAVDYKNFTVGISTRIPVSANRFYLNEANSIEKESITPTFRQFHMYGKYESQSERRVTFDPLFGMYWGYASASDYSAWLGYAGGHIQIVDIVGVGITAGSLVSVSTTLNIKDRVELMLGIYSGEKILSSGLSSLEYRLNFGDKSYILQLRINL